MSVFVLSLKVVCSCFKINRCSGGGITEHKTYPDLLLVEGS